MERIAALEDAIAKKNLVGIYSVFYTIAHGDPGFATNKFRDVFRYVKSKNIEGFLATFDGEEFEPEENWDEEYWALVASSLVDNFCEERIDHLEQVGRKVYAAQMNMKPVQQHKPALVSEEEKQQLKENHTKRAQKDIGGFFKNLLGSRR